MAFRDTDEVFIPLTLTRTRNTVFNEWTPLKVMLFIGFGIFGTIVIRENYVSYYKISIHGEWWFALIMLILIWSFAIWGIRKFAIKEKYLLEMYDTFYQNSLTDSSVFWGAHEVGELIRYTDGSVGCLIKCERGFTNGRPPEFEEQHFDSVTKFIRHLIRNGLYIRYYNNAIYDPNTKPLDETEKMLNQNKASGIYAVEMQVVRYLREVSKGTAETEEDYFLVQTRDFNYSHFDENVRQAMAYLDDTIFSSVKICDKKEVLDFVKDYFGLGYINEYNLGKQVFGKKVHKYLRVKEVIYGNGLKAEAFVRIGQEEKEKELEEAREHYARMQELAKIKDQEEYDAKVRWILEKKGHNVSHLSKSKYKKLSSKITQDEMNQAEKHLNALRQRKVAMLETQARMKKSENQINRVGTVNVAKQYKIDAQLALAREAEKAEAKQELIDSDDDMIL